MIWGTGGATLTAGYNNASSTFSGMLTVPLSSSNTNGFPNWNSATWMNFSKIGSGNLTINGNTGTAGNNLQVYGGTLTLSGNGQLGFLSNYVYPTGSIVLDNTAQNQPNSGFRLGLNNLYLQGGNFDLIANAAGTTEMVNQLQFNIGAGSMTLDAAANATRGPTVLQVATVPNMVGGGSGLVHGSNLGARRPRRSQYLCRHVEQCHRRRRGR